jgi:hypothetical protein
MREFSSILLDHLFVSEHSHIEHAVVAKEKYTCDNIIYQKKIIFEKKVRITTTHYYMKSQPLGARSS